MSIFHLCMDWTVSYERLPSNLSSAKSLQTFFSFGSLLVTPFHIFLSHLLRKLPLTLKVLHWLNQAFSSIFSKWPKLCNILSCKHSLVLFNFSLVLSSLREILRSGLILHIHLTILAPSLSSLIPYSSLTGQVSLPYDIMLHTHVEYNLTFIYKEYNMCNAICSWIRLKLEPKFGDKIRFSNTLVKQKKGVL